MKTCERTAALADGQSFKNRLWKYRECYILLLPMLALILLFSYGPFYGIILAFKKYRMIDGIWGSPWCGLWQFKKIFATESFWKVMSNTIEISGLRILFGFPAPIILAIALNEVRHNKYKKVIQTVSYLPHFMSWVVIAGIMLQIFSVNSGVINYVIKALGFEPISFMTSSSWFRTILISTGIWQGVGWASIIYLATIAGIDPQIYEAARVDGANRFHLIRYVTFPSLYPVMSILFILTIGNIMNAGFDQIFNMYNPMVYNVADILDTYVYRRGFGAEGQASDYSFATAVGLFKNVIGFMLVVVTNFVTKKLNDTGIW